MRHVRLLWYTFIEVIGIKNLDSIPDIKDPEGPDTKAAIYMYSMESFLYKRLNIVVRNKLEHSVKTLGPYSALMSRVIKKKSNERNKNKIEGEFVIFRGLSLPLDIVESWKK